MMMMMKVMMTTMTMIEVAHSLRYGWVMSTSRNTQHCRTSSSSISPRTRLLLRCNVSIANESSSSQIFNFAKNKSFKHFLRISWFFSSFFFQNLRGTILCFHFLLLIKESTTATWQSKRYKEIMIVMLWWCLYLFIYLIKVRCITKMIWTDVISWCFKLQF